MRTADPYGLGFDAALDSEVIGIAASDIEWRGNVGTIYAKPLRNLCKNQDSFCKSIAVKSDATKRVIEFSTNGEMKTTFTDKDDQMYYLMYENIDSPIYFRVIFDENEAKHLNPRTRTKLWGR